VLRTDCTSSCVDYAASTAADDAGDAFCDAGGCVGEGAGGRLENLTFVSNRV